MTAVFYGIMLNPVAECLDDINVRQAIQMAVDRQEAADTAMFGLTEPQCVEFPWNWVHDPSIEENSPLCKHDKEAARQKIAESKYPDGCEFTLAVSQNYKAAIDAAQLIQEDLADIGLTANIDIWSSGSPYYDRDFDAWFAVWNYTNRDPHQAFTAGSNLRPVNSPMSLETLDFYDEYVDLLDQGLNETDQEKRREIYIELQEFVLDKSWQIIIARFPHGYAYWDYVHNFDPFTRLRKVDYFYTETWLDQ
jgi:peptide/nickel transport system substrate-binding protein